MTKTMLVDATHPEETRVAIVDGNRLSDFDFERASKKQLKGNIYLAKVIRIEPSLQAAFVEYGGNRHGFLPFSEIHPDYFRIPMADRPHDAPADDDVDHDDGGDENEVSDDISAYVEEREAVENPLALIEAIEEQALPLELPAPTLLDEPTNSTEFAQDPSHDLGLITDFGNAALEPLVASELPSVEVVGGEVAEEVREQRVVRPRYKIQEVVKRRQVMLIQVVKEERGNKGAALTTFLSLAGRYCVLMPNTDHGGGVSRKITSHQDRRRMKEMLDQLEVPEGMAVILRTAGMEQEPAEIQRDLEYLLRLWNSIREETLQSTAPAMIYEEANLIKRSLRDLYANDLDAILVAGTKGYQLAYDFMRTIMPDSLDKVKPYEESVPLFFRYNVEKQIDQLYSPVVQLRSGGYIVINPTEALVSIDVNSGRATRERHIESTALKTNVEAADEVGRQLRLRDLAGLIVIDFIDMEDGRNNATVERRMKEAMKADRARLQIGRISPFGLMELSRQRLHPSLMEINFEKCPHCEGMGLVRSVDSAAISILRMIEEEGIKGGASELVLHVPTKVALYILNQKRSALSEIERRYSLQVFLHSDDAMAPSEFKLERARSGSVTMRERGPAVNNDQVFASSDRPATTLPVSELPDGNNNESTSTESTEGERQSGNRGRRPGRNGFNRQRNNRPPHQDRQPYAGPSDPSGQVEAQNSAPPNAPAALDENGNAMQPPGQPGTGQDQEQRRTGRRRGRRGGRGRNGGGAGGAGGPNGSPRPPRDPNYQPRHEQRDNNWTPNQNAPTGQAPVAARPVNVHDLDTTPRGHTPSQQNYAAQPSSQNNRPASSTSPYEVVQDSPEKPKGGWWRKLTGG